jgi:hypothetical protein
MPREAAALSVDVECYASYRGEETPDVQIPDDPR